MIIRIFLLFFVSFFSSCLYAESYDYTMCNILNVRIVNSSANDCVIKKYYIPFGAFAKKSQMPEVIFRNKEATFSLTNDQDLRISSDDRSYLQTSMVIQLQCGDDTEIALFTNTPFITQSSVLERKNMRAKGTYQYCNNIKSTARPWQITWTLLPPEEFQL